MQILYVCYCQSCRNNRWSRVQKLNIRKEIKIIRYTCARISWPEPIFSMTGTIHSIFLYAINKSFHTAAPVFNCVQQVNFLNRIARYLVDPNSFFNNFFLRFGGTKPHFISFPLLYRYIHTHSFITFAEF
jgi:hypothetical protein